MQVWLCPVRFCPVRLCPVRFYTGKVLSVHQTQWPRGIPSSQWKFKSDLNITHTITISWSDK
jgi:hypothetical protein